MHTLKHLIPLLALPALAHAADNTGAIRGAADPGAQIVVLNLDDGAVSGYMATCDGRYTADRLKPGRYRIRQDGPRHAARELTVTAGRVSETDLAPNARNACGTQGSDGGKQGNAARPA